MKGKLREIVEGFSRIRLAVLGDFIADEFIHGETSRISREAPVLVLNFNSRKILPGGGGNAAMNAASLGGKILAIGSLGDDSSGRDLIDVLKKCRVNIERLSLEKGRISPTKMRIMAGGRNTSRQQVIRIDHEPRETIRGEMENRVLRSMGDMKHLGVNALIVSDYGLGCITEKVREAAQNLSGEMIVTVDSRNAVDSFRGVTAITPNEEEVEALLGFSPNSERIDQAGKILLERTCAQGVLITRGSKGMSLFEKNSGRKDLPIYGSDEVADVTGAGDTVISAFTLALAAGASMMEAADIANRAAGLVVMKRGTAVVDSEELLTTFDKDS